MERIEIKNGLKRGLTGSALVAALAFTGLAQAEGTAYDGNKEKAHTAKAQPSEQQNRSPALSGLSREQVKDVQRELASRGLYQGSIDGVPGAKTEAALRNFQTQQGLAVGSLNAPTRDALGIDWSKEPARASAPIQQKDAQRQNVSGSETQRAQKQPVRGTDDGRTDAQPARSAIEQNAGRDVEIAGKQLSSLSTDQAKQLQQRLHREGYYQGEVDGVVGMQTRIALKRYFQKQAQLADQGMVSESALPMFEVK
jgi:peptidoglycan hydrolase-like protein with peptidoglycan-binding domain